MKSKSNHNPTPCAIPGDIPDSDKLNFVLDENGQVLSLSKSFELHFPFATAGHSFSKILLPEEHDRFESLMHDVAVNDMAQAPFQITTISGLQTVLVTLFAQVDETNTSYFRGLAWQQATAHGQVAAESKLEAIFQHDMECVKILDLQGRLLDINPTGNFMLEVDHSVPLIGTQYTEAILPEDLSIFNYLLEKAATGEPEMGEYRLQTFKGNLCWVEAKAVPLRGADGQISSILMIGRDITQRKVIEQDMEEAKREAEENARKMLAIAESTHDCLFMISADGRLEYYNQNAKMAVGMEGVIELGQPLETVMEAAHALQFLPRYQEALQTQQAVHFEDYYRHRQMWVEVNVYPANGGILVYFRNINERKEAELQLALSEQKFRAMVQNGSDIIAVLDESLHIQYLSPTVARIAGYQPEELLGQPVSRFIPEEDNESVQEALAEVLLYANDGLETAHRFKHRDGHYIWLESKAINLIREDNIRGIIINARDISHHKQLEAKLALEVQNRQKEVTNAVIRAQERERSQLSQELHDNVNQVLTTIKLYNEMVMEGLGESKDLLHRSVFHLQGCINEIRSISKRLSAPTLEKISISDSIRELVESVNLTNRLSITYKIEGLDDCVISQDLHLAIYRIIQEQLNNTLKYAQANSFQINIANSAQGLCLALHDDGQGFDLTIKRTGIGITNMKTRAENLNGSFHIYSRPGGGCGIKVLFPPIEC